MTVIDDLENAHHLLVDGSVTQQEYDQIKRELLAEVQALPDGSPSGAWIVGRILLIAVGTILVLSVLVYWYATQPTSPAADSTYSLPPDSGTADAGNNGDALIADVEEKLESDETSKIEQPKGWRVQFVDAACTVETSAAAANAEESPWIIRMGYLAGNQLVFMFSAESEAYRSQQIPEKTLAWFLVGDESFPALRASIVRNELIVPVENSLKLQRALTNARSLGVKILLPNSSSPAPIAGFELSNIQGAMDWLSACNLVGAGALPQ